MLALVRLIVGAIPRSGAPDEEPARIVLQSVRRRNEVRLVACSTALGPSSRFDRAARLELEVNLVDWQGGFLVSDDGERVEVGFAVPACGAAAGPDPEDRMGPL